MATTLAELSQQNLQFGGTPQLRNTVMEVARTSRQASIISEMIDALVAVGGPPRLIESATLVLIERTEPTRLSQ
jgi:hypothetical protein